MTKQQLVTEATEIKINNWIKTGDLKENQQWKKEAIYKGLFKLSKQALTDYIKYNEVA